MYRNDSSRTSSPARPYGVRSRRKRQIPYPKKPKYRAAPTNPLQMKSSQSCPVLPTASWPQVGHLGDGPTAIDVGLPRSCRVSPKPTIGEAAASRTDSADRFERRLALPPVDRRAPPTAGRGG